MRIIFALILLALSLNAHTQTKETKQRKCSEIINELSYFWKLDSLGTNGLRLYSYDLILKARLDTLRFDTLFSKLGKSNMTLTSQKDVQYLYFYLDPRKLRATDYGSFGAIHYIGFTRKKNEDIISQISSWHLDL